MENFERYILMPKKSKFNSTEIRTEIVNGDCPKCESYTVLVSIYENIFRCMTCGYDLEQKVNGKISYIPRIANARDIDLALKKL